MFAFSSNLNYRKVGTAQRGERKTDGGRRNDRAR